MATHYSNHFESTGGTTVTARETGHIPAGGLNGERMLVSGASIKSLSLTTDVMRMNREIPSNARIWMVWAGADDASAAGAFDLGVYQTEANGGAVVDADRFGSALAKSINAEVFAESAVLKPSDRGKRLWELLGLTADPKIAYDICCTPTTSFTTTALGVTVILEYTLA